MHDILRTEARSHIPQPVHSFHRSMRLWTVHPRHEEPLASIADYLRAIAEEATARGYAFNTARIVAPGTSIRPITETRGQLLYEWEHLCRKLERRSPAWYQESIVGTQPTPHPLFRLVDGGIREWERPTKP